MSGKRAKAIRKAITNNDRMTSMARHADLAVRLHITPYRVGWNCAYRRVKRHLKP